MAYVWSDALSVGIPEIDGQHQELLIRANLMLRAQDDGRDPAEIERVAKLLGEHVREHFEAEERRMEDSGYPGLAAHRRSHEAFAPDFERLMRDMREGEPTHQAVRIVHRRICSWVCEHIRQCDMEFGDYLNSRIRRAA